MPARPAASRAYSVEIVPDGADVKMGDPVFSRLLCAADRILENPAFDPADTNLVVTLIFQAVAREDYRTASALRQAELRRRDELIRRIAENYEGSTREGVEGGSRRRRIQIARLASPP
jgi:hypothetical protein